EFSQLTGAFGLELIDAHFQSPSRHRKFGAQLIFLSLDFSHRQTRCGFEPTHGQSYWATVHYANNHEPDQCGNEKSEPEIDDRFIHRMYASNSRALIEKPSALSPASPAGDNTSPKPCPRRGSERFRLCGSWTLVNPVIRMDSRSAAG